MTTNRAAVVVYGRTASADYWWRTVPAGEGRSLWLSRVVLATVGGGRNLHEPRFVLSRGGDKVLLGVACEAGDLSETMNSHEHRKLYCFVGWLLEPGSSGLSLPEFARDYVALAGPVYEHWVRRHWTMHRSRLREPEVNQYEVTPWRAAPPTVSSSAPSTVLAVEPGRVDLLPYAEREAIWDAGLCTDTSDFVLVTGWADASRADLVGVTHLCAVNVMVRRSVPAPPVAPGETSPAVASVAQDGAAEEPPAAEPGPVERTGRTPKPRGPYHCIHSSIGTFLGEKVRSVKSHWNGRSTPPRVDAPVGSPNYEELEAPLDRTDDPPPNGSSDSAIN